MAHRGAAVDMADILAGDPVVIAQALAAGAGCEAFDRGSLGRRAGKATAAALQLANFNVYVPVLVVPFDVALRFAFASISKNRHRLANLASFDLVPEPECNCHPYLSSPSTSTQQNISRGLRAYCRDMKNLRSVLAIWRQTRLISILDTAQVIELSHRQLDFEFGRQRGIALSAVHVSAKSP